MIRITFYSMKFRTHHTLFRNIIRPLNAYMYKSESVLKRECEPSNVIHLQWEKMKSTSKIKHNLDWPMK